MAARSASVMRLVEEEIFSAIEPAAVAWGLMPVARNFSTSAWLHWPRPSHGPPVRLLANQWSTRPPAKGLSVSSPNRMFFGVWQAAQWPSPFTRYSPRRHCAPAPHGRGGRRLARIKPIPENEPKAQIEGEYQLVGRGRLVHGRQGLQISEEIVGILPRDAGEIDIRQCRIEMGAARRDAIMQGAVEILFAPAADPGLPVGRDIGGIDRAEGGVEGNTAGKILAVGRCVAAGAIAQDGKIAAPRRGIFRTRARREGKPYGQPGQKSRHENMGSCNGRQETWCGTGGCGQGREIKGGKAKKHGSAIGGGDRRSRTL